MGHNVLKVHTASEATHKCASEVARITLPWLPCLSLIGVELIMLVIFFLFLALIIWGPAGMVHNDNTIASSLGDFLG